MANPQTEEGYTKIANEVLEAMALAPWGGLTFNVILCVMRLTWGWNKKAARLTWPDIGRKIKSDRGAVRTVGLELINEGVLILDSDGLLSIQKDYEKWGSLSPIGCHSSRGVRTKGGGRHTHLREESHPFARGVTPILPSSLKTERKERKEIQQTRPLTFDEINHEHMMEAIARDRAHTAEVNAQMKAARLAQEACVVMTPEERAAAGAKWRAMYKSRPTQ